MLELGRDNAADYLACRGFRCSSVESLGGGVSNTVLLAETDRGRLVLKQSLGKLRVEQDWYSDRHRIFRESESMRALKEHLPPGAVPEILFEDRENFAFAMTAAADGARTWKSLLMDGIARPETAETIGRMLGALIRVSWQNPLWRERFGDQTVFDELRLDPYYRTTAARHPGLRSFFETLIRQAQTRCVSLVHGDWSPKNFLVGGDAVMAIDFEVVHFGDPAFDSAFLLNHLVLKSFYKPEYGASYARVAGAFWQALIAGMPPDAAWFEPATIQHLGGLLLARIDGKSPAEYIRDEGLKDDIRSFAYRIIEHPPASIRALFEIIPK